MPDNRQRFVMSQNACLDMTLYGAVGYLNKDNTIAHIVRSGAENGVAIYGIGLHLAAVIVFAVEVQLFAFAHLVCLCAGRNRINLQVQTIDTICSVNGLIFVFVCLLFSCRMTQTAGDRYAVYLPIKRCVRHADSGVRLIQEGRINDQYQLMLVRAFSCKLLGVVIGARGGVGGVWTYRPNVRLLVVIAFNRIGTECTVAEVEIYEFYTIASMNSLERGVYYGTFCNGTIVVTIGSFVATDVDVADDRIGIARPYGQIQYIYFFQVLLDACGSIENRVFVYTAGFVPIASPFDAVSVTNRGDKRISRSYNRCRIYVHFQFIDTVASVNCGVRIAVDTFRTDVLAMPCQDLAFHDGRLLFVVECLCFVQADLYN